MVSASTDVACRRTSLCESCGRPNHQIDAFMLVDDSSLHTRHCKDGLKTPSLEEPSFPLDAEFVVKARCNDVLLFTTLVLSRRLKQIYKQ